MIVIFVVLQLVLSLHVLLATTRPCHGFVFQNSNSVLSKVTQPMISMNRRHCLHRRYHHRRHNHYHHYRNHQRSVAPLTLIVAASSTTMGGGTSSSSSSQSSSEEEEDYYDIEEIFNAMDVDNSGTIDIDELSNYLSKIGYTKKGIQNIFSNIDLDGNGEISKTEFHQAMTLANGQETEASEEGTNIVMEQSEIDMIFAIVDTDGSGAIDLEEMTNHLTESGYTNNQIKTLFAKMDLDDNGEISKTEFRQAMMVQPETVDNNNVTDVVEDCPRGYFLNSVKQSCEPLGPIGKISQRVEMLGPFQRAYKSISNLFGVDAKKISKLGISFALSYSIISNLNGAMSLSVAWYISCKRTGLSPLVPGQWKSLLTSYGMIYGLITLLRPFRVAAAIGMSKLSAEYLELTQSKFNCNRATAIVCQYIMGVFMMGVTAFTGVSIVSLLTGVPIWG